MNIHSPSAPATAVNAEPSPLLRHLAPGYAPRIAGAWPKPHTPFLSAPADRRHLICLALSRSPDQALAFPDGLLGLALRDAIALALPDAPPGLARALGRVGEIAWEPDDYVRLLEALSHSRLSAPLRHAKLIEAGNVRALSALPPGLREAGLARRPLTLAQIAVLEETYRVLSLRHGEARARALARNWGAGSSLKDTFERAARDLTGEFPSPPYPGSESLRAITTRAELAELAARYNNCALNYENDVADGAQAFYEWTGEPNVLVCLECDRLYGWTLAEARIINDGAPPEPARNALVNELRRWGVNVGYTHWRLKNLLQRAHRPEFVFDTIEQAIGSLFGD